MKSKVFRKAPRRKPVFFVKYKKKYKTIFFLCFSVLVAGSGGFYGASKFLEKAPLWVESFSKKAGFTLEDIAVEGRQTTSCSKLLQALGVKRGDSLFSLSPQDLKRKLEKLPWIRSAVVERQFPQTLHIHLAEKKPLALWQVKGKIKVLDQEGQVVHCSPEEIQEELILLVGEDAKQYAGAFLEVLEKVPVIKKRVLSAVCSRNGRWDLYLDNKWVLKLPENRVEKALYDFLSLENQHPFLRDKVIAVDLRLTAGDLGTQKIVIRLTPKVAAEIKRKKPRALATGKEV